MGHWDVAVGDVYGGICLYFGNDCFYLVLVWEVDVSKVE